MRHIIIPLVSIFYLYWTYTSIKHIVNNGGIDADIHGSSSTFYWVGIHGLALIAFLILLTVKYW